MAFAPPHSTVSIKLDVTGAFAEVVVSDRGPGIDPHIRSKVFHRFVTTRPSAGGTGLGLAIVQAVAQAHGGVAEIRSSGSGGTTVALKLSCR